MPAIFKHNNKLIQCMNLQKKLKKMKISEDSIEIVWQGEATQNELEKRFVSLTTNKKEEQNDDEPFIKYYHFLNVKTGHKIHGVDNNLDRWHNINKSEWIEINEPELR